MVIRVLFFVYGCAVTSLFFGTFLYAIAFVGGFAVPTGWTARRRRRSRPALAIDAGSADGLCRAAQRHGAPLVQARWTQIVPWAIERSTYVLFASLALILLFWQWRPLGGPSGPIDQPLARRVWTLFAFGWLQVLVMTFYINHFDLFGLRQVWLHLNGRQYTRVSLRDPGALPSRPPSALSGLPSSRSGRRRR